MSEITGRLAWLLENRLPFENVSELAAAVRQHGFSRSTVYRWHGGRSEVPASYAVVIAQMAKVDVIWLVTGEGTPDGPPSGAGYADGALWAVDQVQSAALRIRRQLEGGPVEPQGKDLPIAPVIPTEISLLIQLDVFVSRSEVQKKGPDPLTAGVALIEQHVLPCTDPTDPEKNTWEILTHMLRVSGALDGSAEVEWTEPEAIAMGLRLPPPDDPDEERTAG